MTMIRRATSVLFLSAAALTLVGCGAGNGTVYVGVGVAGPWGYPGAYPGGYYPRPVYGRPCCVRYDTEDGAVQDRDAAEPDLAELAYDAPPALEPDPDWLNRLR